MNKKVINRVKEEAIYLLKTKETIRNIAKEFNVSKSTVHKDFNDRLEIISTELSKKVQKILKEHIMTRHIKGGESTRIKYQKA